MNRRQKRVVAILAIANALIITTLMTLMLPAIKDSARPHSNSQPEALLESQVGCQWQATQLLAREGIAGTVTLTPQGLLRFQLTHSLAPSQTIDEAAPWEWVWAVLLAVSVVMRLGRYSGA